MFEKNSISAMQGENVYYNPEAFGLTPIGEVEFSSGSYEFDTLVLWRSEQGTVYYAHDSGCSCPTPFDGYTALTDLDVLPTIKALDDFYRTEDDCDDRSQHMRIEAGIFNLKERLLELVRQGKISIDYGFVIKEVEVELELP